MSSHLGGVATESVFLDPPQHLSVERSTCNTRLPFFVWFGLCWVWPCFVCFTAKHSQCQSCPTKQQSCKKSKKNQKRHKKSKNAIMVRTRISLVFVRILLPQVQLKHSAMAEWTNSCSKSVVKNRANCSRNRRSGRHTLKFC